MSRDWRLRTVGRVGQLEQRREERAEGTRGRTDDEARADGCPSSESSVERLAVARARADVGDDLVERGVVQAREDRLRSCSRR